MSGMDYVAMRGLSIDQHLEYRRSPLAAESWTDRRSKLLISGQKPWPIKDVRHMKHVYVQLYNLEGRGDGETLNEP